MSKILKKDEYQCAYCGNIYKKGWSEEEAIKERNELWDNPSNQWERICDFCFKLILRSDKHYQIAISADYAADAVRNIRKFISQEREKASQDCKIVLRAVMEYFKKYDKENA